MQNRGSIISRIFGNYCEALDHSQNRYRELYTERAEKAIAFSLQLTKLISNQMLGFFPKLYPGELLYSAIAHYHIRSGNLSPKLTIEELFNINGDSIACSNIYTTSIPLTKGTSLISLRKFTTSLLHPF